MEKQKYKGTFNWHSEIIILWTHANSTREAKRQFIIQLSEKLNRTPESLRRYYSGVMSNYEIKEI